MINRLAIQKVAQHKRLTHFFEPLIGWRCQRSIAKASRTKCVVFLDSSVFEPDHELDSDHEDGHERDHAKLLRQDLPEFRPRSSWFLEWLIALTKRFRFRKKVGLNDWIDQNNQYRKERKSLTVEGTNEEIPPSQKWRSGVHQTDAVKRNFSNLIS